MGLMRSALLAGSESPWLRERATRTGLVRRAVRRFMPGERLEDAMSAAAGLQRERLGTVVTHLGENVTDLGQADAVARDYVEVLRRLREAGLDTEISVKLTHFGLDIDRECCHANLRALVEAARAAGTYVWVDMEQHSHVDATLDIYRRARAEFPNVGVCLQAYLYRTADDLEALVPLGPGIRLVKGAYREPATVAHPKKRDVDESYLALARRMLDPEAARAAVRAVFGTHDLAIIAAIGQHAARAEQDASGVEYHLLYGIQQAEQRRLASRGHRVRVLISYGDCWFPWYMRRLAERPANLWFVARNVFSG